MVRAAVQELGLPHVTSGHRIVTVSVGVASTVPNDALQPSDLVEAADAGLYVAKRSGRNRVAGHGLGWSAESGDPMWMAS
jgi:diguanylate cyclase (GGDEF)-like protein